MTFSTIHPLEMGYDLHTPCAECPFRRDVPHHEGISTDLVELFMQMEMGRAAQSCHKTDPRSDGFVPTYRGKVQHCAGFMVMQAMNSDRIQDALRAAEKAGRLDLAKLDLAADVFRPLEMLESYAEWMRMTLDRRQAARAMTDAEAEGWPVALPK